jgi:hypothetical protein
MSLAEYLPIPAASDTTASASEDENNPTNPPKRSWVKLNHPPSSKSSLLKKGVGQETDPAVE